jgi:hypothetical protein
LRQAVAARGGCAPCNLSKSDADPTEWWAALFLDTDDPAEAAARAAWLDATGRAALGPAAE